MDRPATSRLCGRAGAQVFEGQGPTVLDALAAVVDDLANRGDLNPTLLGVYAWEPPEWVPGDDRYVILTVSP